MVLNDFSDLNYHLVASPVKSIKLDQLPPKIASIIAKTKIGDVTMPNFNLIQFGDL